MEAAMATVNGVELKQVLDPRIAKAFTHPLRGHAWVTICEKGEASAKEIGDELGLDPSDVSYHFRELKRRKLIKLHRTVQRRGFVECFYKPAVQPFYFDDFDWMGIPMPIRSTFSGDMLRQVVDELIAALEVGSFDARDRHLSRTWLLADEQGWEEVMRIIEQALRRILAIQKSCAKRLRKSAAPGIPMSIVMTAFETAAARSKAEEGDA
jgi:DNA-binding transcriptional ArsR family regulator